MLRWPSFWTLRFLILVALFSNFLTVNLSKCQTSNIAGYVMDASTGRPIPGAWVIINSEHYLTTNPQGYFSFEVTSEGWYTIYAFCDEEDTVGIDYVPSRWRIYLEKGTNAYRVLSLWPGASIEVEGQIRLVEKSIPAQWFRFRVQPQGGTVWGDSSSVSEYGLVDSSEELGLDTRLIIVPAGTYVSIRMESRVPDDIYRVFTIQNGSDYFNLRQGEKKVVNIEEKTIGFNIESVKEMLNLSLDLLQRVETAGFLVKAEHRDVERAMSLFDASRETATRGSYDEAFALLRNSYISAKEVANRLQGLLNVSMPSSLVLTFFFAFIALALTCLLVEQGTYLEISSHLKSEHSILIPLRPLSALLIYVIVLSLFFAVYPGCRLASFSAFSFAAVSSFIAVACLFLLGSNVLEGKRSTDRSIALGSATIVAFSMATGSLRRMKLRSVLNILSLMTLVFGFIVLTSISPSYGFVSRTIGPSEIPLDALMVVNPPVTAETKFVPLTKDFIKEIGNHPNSTLTAPKAESFPSLTPISRIFAASGKNASINGVIGIIPSVESKVTGLDTTITKGEFLKDDDVDQVLISESLAKYLLVDVGSSVNVFGRSFTVAGIFNDESLGKILEMNGEVFLPSRLQATPGGIYLTQCWSHEIVITEFETALTLTNVAISRVFVQMKDPEDLMGLADIVALTRDYSVWVSFAGKLYQKYVGTYIEEKGMVITPFLMILGTLIVGSTMFGSVYERRQSIFTLSSIGLNPTHVAALFMAESMTIGFIAGGLGYLLGVSGYRTIGLMSGLAVREKVSAEWSLIALSFSMFTAVLATVIPSLKASTIVTPSHLRRWRPEEKETPGEEGKPWVVELPVKLRPREVDFFCAYVERSLSELLDSLIERVEKVRVFEEKTDGGLVKRIAFDYVAGEMKRPLRTNNELVIERPETEKHYTARLLSLPDGNFEEAVLKTSTMIRRLILEWNAQKVVVITPFESSLNQLYSLVRFYNPRVIYVVAERDVSNKLEPLKNRLESEGISVPQFFTAQIKSSDPSECARMAEELVSKAGFVCVSGDSATVCVVMALAAAKLKKRMCRVIKSSRHPGDPFRVSKVVMI